MDCASQIYTEASRLKEDVYEEKLTMVAMYLQYRQVIMNQFFGSKYLINAINYIDSYFKRFIVESCIEHDFYIRVIDYLASLEYITDCDDQEFINNISEEFFNLEECYENRSTHFGNFMSHLNNLIQSNILTNYNYLFINYPTQLTFADAIRMKVLILREKNKGTK